MERDKNVPPHTILTSAIYMQGMGSIAGMCARMCK